MVVDMSRMSKEELIEMNKKAIAQISKLVDENNALKKKLNESERERMALSFPGTLFSCTK